MINKIKNNKKILIFSSVFVIVLVIALVIIKSISGSSSKRIQEQLALGIKYLEELNYEQAIASFNAVLEIDPQNEEAYLALVDAYAGLDDADSMVTVYDRALNNLTEAQLSRLADKISEKLILMIEAAINFGDYDRAEYIVLILKRFDPEKASEYEKIIEESKKKPVAVPDIIDTLWEDSQKELDSIGLLYDVTEENGMDLPGYVLSIAPFAGSELFEGDKVSVTVSAGFADIPDEMVEVDDLLGMTLEEARNTLAEKYLYIIADGSDYSDTISKDGVRTQSIEPGTKVKTGETIHVTVSDGIEQVEVPDVVGMKSGETQTTIAEHDNQSTIGTLKASLDNKAFLTISGVSCTVSLITPNGFQESYKVPIEDYAIEPKWEVDFTTDGKNHYNVKSYWYGFGDKIIISMDDMYSELEEVFNTDGEVHSPFWDIYVSKSISGSTIIWNFDLPEGCSVDPDGLKIISYYINDPTWYYQY